ncbi:MAG: TIGR03984 family CRISPR-associated protein [Anaerolineae bacterium]|nr:TIGR03984 family CRISPR-associated protein [Anaerolineae bacterium]
MRGPIQEYTVERHAFDLDATQLAEGQDVVGWLGRQGDAVGRPWLLAHAYDGVIWGEWRADGLHLSSDAVPAVSPPLNKETLLEARVFGPSGEVHVWRTERGWRVRSLEDGAGAEQQQAFDEDHLLWGTELAGEPGQAVVDGFVLVQEGEEGLRHAPPLGEPFADAVSNEHRAKLTVRHYIDYDADGQATIAFSRLVELRPQPTSGGER